MRIPRTLVIRGQKWTVRKVRGKHEGVNFSEDETLGFCIPRKKSILICADLDRELQEITLIHEILHAVFPVDVISAKTEEKIIEGIDEALHAVLKKAVLKKPR